METTRILKTIAILLAVLFIMIVTAGAVSATPVIPLPPPGNFGWGFGGWLSWLGYYGGWLF